MIARMWRRITLAVKADAYIDYLHQTGLHDMELLVRHYEFAEQILPGDVRARAVKPQPEKAGR